MPSPGCCSVSPARGDGGKEFEVKPLSSAGAVADHNAITAVEAVLQAGGEKLTLRRTLRELWSTKRGGEVESFDGNSSEFFIDGVPCKRTPLTSGLARLSLRTCSAC